MDIFTVISLFENIENGRELLKDLCCTHSILQLSERDELTILKDRILTSGFVHNHWYCLAIIKIKHALHPFAKNTDISYDYVEELLQELNLSFKGSCLDNILDEL